MILLHGWPYDPRTYDAMVPPLIAAGCRTVVPICAASADAFLSPQTPRWGQQAALGHDLIELMNALSLNRAALVGYDWGGRAACIVAALWPERVRCLVTVGGYNIQDIARSGMPACARAGASLLVSVLFQYRARPRRACREPPRLLPADVAAVVAQLGIR